MSRHEGPRCEAVVKRYSHGGEFDARDAVYVDEPCGRIGKTRLEVGVRTVWLCHVHDRKLRATGAATP